jgi:hypothetical protein
MVPDADYLYACDPQWWAIHIDDVRKVFRGKLYTQYHTDEGKKEAKRLGIEAIQGAHNKGLGRGMLHFNSNSGAQAINLAYLLGARSIGLLGYDMGATGRTHFFGEHPKGLQNGNYEKYVPEFNKLAKDLEQEGVEVINCTRKTLLTQFKQQTLEAYAGHHHRDGAEPDCRRNQADQQLATA